MNTPFALGDRVTVNASRSITAPISGVVVAIDPGNSHTPERMICIKPDDGASFWVYAWRLTKVEA